MERRNVQGSSATLEGNVDETEGSNDFKPDRNYFSWCSIWQYFTIVLGLTVFMWLALLPYTFPFDSLGGPGSRLKFVAENYRGILLACVPIVWTVHIIEAGLAHQKCTKIGLSEKARTKWVVQTFLLGYTSLQMLTFYEEKLYSKRAKHS